MTRDGNNHVYALDLARLESLSKGVFEPEQLALMSRDVDPRRWQTKVLSSFFDGDRLTQIPASRKKREVILEWLVNRFEVAQRYSEPEVNAILKQHHEDCATLRRELVGYRLMHRERGMYWRPSP